METTLATVRVSRRGPGRPKTRPRRLIGDKAYDSERTNAWLSQFRRLVVRHEHLLTVYLGFFHIACAMIALRQL
ncbi:MAG: hypothetical protein AABZ94_01075 [Candidatus Eisenbacteria bacterium]